jgi:hypothetical protein
MVQLFQEIALSELFARARTRPHLEVNVDRAINLIEPPPDMIDTTHRESEPVSCRTRDA